MPSAFARMFRNYKVVMLAGLIQAGNSSAAEKGPGDRFLRSRLGIGDVGPRQCRGSLPADSLNVDRLHLELFVITM